MVLQSPIASAGLVIFRESIARALAGFDLFRNYEKIPRVLCRTLLIHGREDTMVPFTHALMLFPLLRDAHDPLRVDGASRVPPTAPCYQGFNALSPQARAITICPMKHACGPFQSLSCT